MASDASGTGGAGHGMADLGEANCSEGANPHLSSSRHLGKTVESAHGDMPL